MYRIPLLDGFMLVDCRWRDYDPDRFEIYSIEWEVGILIPKCVWFNLEIPTPIEFLAWYGHKRIYIHDYIFAWLCEHEPIEYDSDY